MKPLFDAAGLIVFERGWLSCNSVLFPDSESDQSVLIDTGYCSHSEQTVALVKRALGQRQLHRVINTHLHSDHCGGNQALQDMFDCRIDVPVGESDKVDRWDESRLTYRDTGQSCPRFRRTGVVRAGDEIKLGARRWHVIAAPGHDPESVVLYEPELQLLISADALWENGFGVVFPELEGEADAFDKVRQTLHRLAELPVRCVIPGHGSPFADAQAAIARANRRLDGFVADPTKHALYAAKVLVKFRLLELHRAELSDLLNWIAATPYMRLVHQRYFNNVAFSPWCSAVVASLVQTGAALVDGGLIHDR